LRRARLSPAFLSLLFLGVTTLNAQTKSDQDLLKQARSRYYSRGLRPSYIACDSTVDWDAIANEPGAPRGEGYQRGLELLKAMKISFVTRGVSHIDVTATGDAMLAQQKKMLKRQITAFFHEYWRIAYDRLLPRPNTSYKMEPTPDGYLVTQQLTDGTITTVEMDRSFLITKAHATGRTQKLELTPKFTMENDGLLHLSDITIDGRIGESRLVYEYTIDYQQAGGFYVPHDVVMTMPGATSYTHTFSNCNALDKNNAPPLPPAQEDEDPQ
jgi:hypothetical protein